MALHNNNIHDHNEKKLIDTATTDKSDKRRKMAKYALRDLGVNYDADNELRDNAQQPE